MHLILTGATGLIGTAVLDAMIRTKDITKISVLTRRPVKFTDDRISVILHNDFTSYDDDLLRKLQGAQGCVWALGISQTEVGKEEYIKITKSFPIAAATAFQTLTPNPSNDTEPKDPFHFVHVSGAGATTSPGRFTSLFARVKGEAELALDDMQKANPSFRVSSVRPAFIDWTGHAELKPYLPDFGVVKTVFPYLFSPLMRLGARSFWSPTEPLGQFLTGMAMGRFESKLAGEGFETLSGGLAIVENAGFRRMMGLDSVTVKEL